MPIYEFDGMRPVVGEGTWIAPSAEIIGNVTIGKNCYIGFGAIIRADFGKITIGNGSLIEEAVVIHGASRVSIGNGVIIGHKVMLHDTTIGNCSLVGMQSMICDQSEIEEWAIVAEKSLVMKKQIIPSRKIFGGLPAAEIGDVTDEHVNRIKFGQEAYLDLTKKYLTRFKRID